MSDATQEEANQMMDGVEVLASVLDMPMRNGADDAAAAAIAINGAAIAAIDVLIRMGRAPKEACDAVEVACRRMADSIARQPTKGERQ